MPTEAQQSSITSFFRPPSSASCLHHRLNSNAKPKKKPPAKPAGNSTKAQLHLDLGQKSFHLTKCPCCGMVYAPGSASDERTHQEYHASTQAVLGFAGWSKERVITEGPAGRMLLVQPTDPAPHVKKIVELCAYLEQAMGLDDGWLLQGSSWKGMPRQREQQQPLSQRSSQRPQQQQQSLPHSSQRLQQQQQQQPQQQEQQQGGQGGYSSSMRSSRKRPPDPAPDATCKVQHTSAPLLLTPPHLPRPHPDMPASPLSLPSLPTPISSSKGTPPASTHSPAVHSQVRPERITHPSPVHNEGSSSSLGHHHHQLMHSTGSHMLEKQQQQQQQQQRDPAPQPSPTASCHVREQQGKGPSPPPPPPPPSAAAAEAAAGGAGASQESVFLWVAPSKQVAGVLVVQGVKRATATAQQRADSTDNTGNTESKKLSGSQPVDVDVKGCEGGGAMSGVGGGGTAGVKGVGVGGMEQQQQQQQHHQRSQAQQSCGAAGTPQKQQQEQQQVLVQQSCKAQMGVKLVWVHRAHRRRGVAKLMLELARVNHLPGFVIPRHMVAFAQPPMLDAHAERYVHQHLACQGQPLLLYDT